MYYCFFYWTQHGILTNTFYDLFCHINMSPNSHVKLIRGVWQNGVSDAKIWTSVLNLFPVKNYVKVYNGRWSLHAVPIDLWKAFPAIKRTFWPLTQFFRTPAVSCSPDVNRLGVVGLGCWLTGKLGRAWVSAWVEHGWWLVMWCWGFINYVLYYLGWC